MSKVRVTQGDIAQAAGVHNTTVSLSLRNCPSIPEATRKRIQAIAEQLGYYPDPALRALVAYRNGLSAQHHRSTLAFLTPGEDRGCWKQLPGLEAAFTGAQRKAAELGYQLEQFWLGEPGLTAKRMSQVLFHRGINGVLVASGNNDEAALAELDWSRLSAIVLGSQPAGPALHRVGEDHAGMMRLAIRRCRAAGFERIGFVVTDDVEDAIAQSWSAGFLAEQCARPTELQLPLLRVSGGAGPLDARTATRQTLARWLEQHRPEVIVSANPGLFSALEALGLVVPRDVAYVDLALETDSRGAAGVRWNSETVGEIAVALLDTQIQQHARGVPRVAATTLIEGTWIDGATLPAARTLAVELWREAPKVREARCAIAV